MEKIERDFRSRRPEPEIEQPVIDDLQELGITPEQVLIENFSVAVNNHINTTARQRGYDSSIALASYVTDPNPLWSSEALAFISWRSAVWAYALGKLDDIQKGSDAIPENTDLFIAELPIMTWPGDQTDE
jgi:hypothetical protein